MKDHRADFEIAPERLITAEGPCFIIAEIGQNHQGDIDNAKKLIRVAKVSYFSSLQYHNTA